MEVTRAAETYKLYRALPKSKYLFEALQELGDSISDDLKIKCMHVCDEAYHQQVLAATETLEFTFKVKIVKINTKEFRQYFVEKLSVDGIGEVSRGILVGYKPCFSLNSASTVSRIVANPTPYSFLTVSEPKKQRKKAVSRKKIRNILEFNPSDNCRKLGKSKDEKAWNRPMPYNEKLRRASTNAEVREIAENFSNLSKWMIIKDRFRKGAKPWPRIVITEELRKVEDIRVPKIHDLYSRDYRVRRRPRDIRLAELARESGGTLHLSGHNIKVQTSSSPDDDHRSYTQSCHKIKNLPFPPFCTLKKKDMVPLLPRSSASQRRTYPQNKNKKVTKKVNKTETMKKKMEKVNKKETNKKKMKNGGKKETMNKMGFISDNEDGPPTPINRSFMDEDGWMEMSEYMHEDKLENTGAGGSGNYEGLDTVDEFHLLEGLVGADLPSFPLNLFQEYIQSSGSDPGVCVLDTETSVLDTETCIPVPETCVPVPETCIPNLETCVLDPETCVPVLETGVLDPETYVLIPDSKAILAYSEDPSKVPLKDPEVGELGLVFSVQDLDMSGVNPNMVPKDSSTPARNGRSETAENDEKQEKIEANPVSVPNAKPSLTENSLPKLNADPLGYIDPTGIYDHDLLDFEPEEIVEEDDET